MKSADKLKDMKAVAVPIRKLTSQVGTTTVEEKQILINELEAGAMLLNETVINKYECNNYNETKSKLAFKCRFCGFIAGGFLFILLLVQSVMPIKLKYTKYKTHKYAMFNQSESPSRSSLVSGNYYNGNNNIGRVEMYGESSYCYLHMSIEKTGTTAIEWIAQSIFENFKKEYDDLHMIDDMNEKYESPVHVLNGHKRDRLNVGKKWLVFDVVHKHKTIDLCSDSCTVNATTGNRRCASTNIMDDCLDYKKAAKQCIGANISASRNKCLSFIPIVRKIRQRKNIPIKIKENLVNAKFFTSIRDPIAAAVSHVYYYNGNNITKDYLAQVISSSNLCAIRAAETAIIWKLATEFLPKLGGEFYPLYFQEMRENPHLFVKKLGKSLGLRLNHRVVGNVVAETSLEHMRTVQDSGVNITRYSGGVKNRKVRKAETKGYFRELPHDVLQDCIKAAEFHLPPQLKAMYGFK